MSIEHVLNQKHQTYMPRERRIRNESLTYFVMPDPVSFFNDPFLFTPYCLVSHLFTFEILRPILTNLVELCFCGTSLTYYDTLS